MQANIIVVGAGVVGLWQALTLARRGFSVRLVEASAEPFSNAASRYAATMLAPDCEFPLAQGHARTFARQGLALWTKHFSNIETNGTLVIAAARDHAELQDLGNQTENFHQLDSEAIADLEPELGTRFSTGLYYPDEAHLPTDDALNALLRAVQEAGVAVTFGQPWTAAVDTSAGGASKATVVDCRGMAARDQLPDLRGVRGERVILKSSSIRLNRPVRLLHPRHPLYVVPWGDGRAVIGATTIESDDASQMSVKSALDLLAMAYALHPEFGEAEIVDFGAGVRPAFPDNLPRIVVDQTRQILHVNGAYRHGFLLAPVLAGATAAYLSNGTTHPWMKMHAATCSEPCIP
ncbi:MAG: FAD-dependent oxidoreductase [Alphaproteobacteria bacterium]|nr:FAD-dependent oxidoreductase [Alphaproteobacteria bacterium]